MNALHTARLVIATLALSGCGSALNAEVQIYDGRAQVGEADVTSAGVDSIQTPAGTLLDLQLAKAAAAATVESLKKPLDSALAETDIMGKEIEAAHEAWDALSKEKPFAAYRDAWIAYAEAVAKEPQATRKEPQKLFDAVKGKREALIAAVTPTSKDRRALRPIYFDALREGATPEALAALALLDTLLCWKGDTSCVKHLDEEQRSLLAADALPATLQALREDIKSLQQPTLPGGEETKSSTTAVAEALGKVKGDLSAAAVKDAWSKVEARITEAISANASLAGGQGKSPADAVAAVRVALRNYAAAIPTDAGVKEEDVERIGAFLAKPEVAALRKGQPPDVKHFEAALAEATEGLKKAPASIRAVAELNPRPGSGLADPNLVHLDEDRWQEEPLDRLIVNASGESDFVIVQDSPTHFSVKQLRFDPKGNFELGMTVADLGLDIATTVLKQVSGVDLGLENGGGSTRDASKRVAEDCRTAVRTMSTSFRSELATLPPANDALPADPATLGRIRGMLKAHHALVSACASALARGDRTEPAPQ